MKARRGRRRPIVDPVLRVAVVTAPSTRDRVVALQEDVKLTKAAILYADEVQLVSPGAEMLGAFAGGLTRLLHATMGGGDGSRDAGCEVDGL